MHQTFLTLQVLVFYFLHLQNLTNIVSISEYTFIPKISLSVPWVWSRLIHLLKMTLHGANAKSHSLTNTLIQYSTLVAWLANVAWDVLYQQNSTTILYFTHMYKFIQIENITIFSMYTVPPIKENMHTKHRSLVLELYRFEALKSGADYKEGSWGTHLQTRCTETPETNISFVTDHQTDNNFSHNLL